MLQLGQGVTKVKSIYLLFLAISLGTLYPVSIGGASYNIQYSEVLLLVLFIILCTQVAKNEFQYEISIYNKTLYISWGLCAVYSVITYYWSNQSTTALSGVVTLLIGLISLLISDNCKDTKVYVTANRILNISLLCQLIFNMFSVLKINGLDFYALKSESVTLAGNSNYISFFFTFGLIYELITKGKRWSIFVAINLLGIILTISRGAILSLIMCLIVYMLTLIFKKKVKNRFKSFFSFGIVILIAYALLNYTEPGKVLMDGFSNGLKANSVSTRYVLWNDTIKQIKDNPFGNGVIWDNDPHNIILRSIRDMGVAFGSIFLIIIVSPFLYLFKIENNKISNEVVALLIAYLSVFIHAQEEVFYLGSTSVIWATSTIVFITKTIQKELKSKDEIKMLTKEITI